MVLKINRNKYGKIASKSVVRLARRKRDKHTKEIKKIYAI